MKNTRQFNYKLTKLQFLKYEKPSVIDHNKFLCYLKT